MTSIQYVWHIRFVTLWEIMILLGRNVKIPHKRTHTHENPDSCGISLWSCSGSVPMRSVTDRSAAAVYSRRIAGPHLLIEPGGLNAEIGISVLVSLVLLRLVGHFQAQNYFLLFFFSSFYSISCFSENANGSHLECNRWQHWESSSSTPRDFVCPWGERHLLASSPAAVLHLVLRACSL